MAAEIIVNLEVIQVDHHKGGMSILPFTSIQLLFHPFYQEPAVVKIGQGVGNNQLLQNFRTFPDIGTVEHCRSVAAKAGNDLQIPFVKDLPILLVRKVQNPQRRSFEP